MVNGELKNSIIRTLAFFAVFHYPLTLQELSRWIFFNFRVSVEDLNEALFGLADQVGEKNGFYFLKGREEDFLERQASVKYVEHKIKIAKRAASLIKNLPFVRGIFICNSVAFGTAKKESDIDLFIVVKKNIWLARFFILGFLQVLGFRPNKKTSEDKICLSFMVSEEALNLENLQIKMPDIYLIYWLEGLIPLYLEDNLLKKIYQNNGWIKKYLGNFSDIRIVDFKTSLQKGFFYNLKRTAEKFWQGSYGTIMNEQAKKIQYPKIERQYWDYLQNANQNVVVNDNIIKLHRNDRRKEIFEEWNKIFSQYLVVYK